MTMSKKHELLTKESGFDRLHPVPTFGEGVLCVRQTSSNGMYKAALHLHRHPRPIVRHVGDILQTSSSEICKQIGKNIVVVRIHGWYNLGQ